MLLAVFLIMGCVGAVSAEVGDEYTPVITEFKATPNSGDGPLEVTFTFSATNTTTFSINYGDDSSPEDAESGVKHTYSDAKTYSAILTATNETRTDSDTVTITVKEVVIPLKADFDMDIRSGVAPLTVKFTDKSTGSPTSYYWEFGNDGNSTEANPTHPFNNSGYYDVVLNISNGTAYSVCTKKIEVKPREITGVGIFGLTAPVSGQSPDTIASVLSTTSEDLNSKPVVSWQYASNGTAVNGTFAKGTIYKAIVTIEAINNYNFTTSTKFKVEGLPAESVTNDLESNNRFVNVTCIYPATLGGITNISSVSITGITLPVGGATKNTTKPTVSSTPSASVDPISTITWKNKSDGSTSGSVFNYETTYQAIITVSAKSGYKFTSGSTATVNGNSAILTEYTDGTSATIIYTCTKTAAKGKILPTINTFTVDPPRGVSPLNVQFTVATTNATTVTLDFGDGTPPSHTLNGIVDHRYSIVGIHTATLTATNSDGNTPRTIQIQVTAPAATSAPTSIQTSAPVITTLSTAPIDEGVIPMPFDIIKEFVRLFFSLFEPTNYLFLVNES